MPRRKASAPRSPEQSGGTSARHLFDRRHRDQREAPGACIDHGGEVPEDAPPLLTGVVGLGRGSARRQVMVEVERRPVVDQPDVAVPDKQGSGCARCGTFLDERVRTRKQLAGEVIVGGQPSGSNPAEPGRESPRIEPHVARSKVLDLRVGLDRAGSSGQAGPAPARASAGRGAWPGWQPIISADQASVPGPGSAELEHVSDQVVGLDDRGRLRPRQGVRVAGDLHGSSKRDSVPLRINSAPLSGE